MNGLSVYWTPHHRRPADYEYMLALQPAVVKLMDAGPPDYQWVRLNLPGSLVIARDWALSEQKSDMLADPVGTGSRHAWEWSEKCDDLGFDPGNTLVLGINEPPVWDAGVIPALVAYTVAFLDGCKSHGLRGGALQLSVGWPANIGEGTAPDWGPYTPVEAAIKRGNHALVLHEYWADAGPSENWGWWGGRFMKCPWDVPIIIGETGVDMYVKFGGGYQGNRGWQGHMNAYAYGAQCAEYVHLCQQDARFFAATVFETDYAAGEWQSFDTEPAWRELVTESQGLPPAQWYLGGVPTPEPPMPTPQPPQTGTLVHPLPKGQYAITQRFNETNLNADGHEGTDFGATALTPVHALADGVVGYAGWDANYGWYVRVWHAALGVHSFYAHLSDFDLLLGETVQAGQVIGTVGSTGNSTGPHLHYEIRIGDEEGYSPAAPKANGRIDPESYCALFGLSLATGDTVGGIQTVYMPLVSG